MVMPNRHASASDYRYGFQDQEKDDEVKGANNSVNYKYRMHDPRVGRFFAVDPLAASFPHNSPYAFSENEVIDAIELEGAERRRLNGGLGRWYPTCAELVKTGEVTLPSSMTKSTLKTVNEQTNSKWLGSHVAEVCSDPFSYGKGDMPYLYETRTFTTTSVEKGIVEIDGVEYYQHAIQTTTVKATYNQNGNGEIN